MLHAAVSFPFLSTIVSGPDPVFNPHDSARIRTLGSDRMQDSGRGVRRLVISRGPSLTSDVRVPSVALGFRDRTAIGVVCCNVGVMGNWVDVDEYWSLGSVLRGSS